MRTENIRTTLLITCVFLLLAVSARAQSLVYAVSYAETPGSFHARYPHGALGASTSDKVAMLRQNRKTEIYSVSMPDGKRSLRFSDEGMNLELSPGGGAVGGDKAYVNGTVREWRMTPIPGAYADPIALYELSLDGSKQFRRLFEKQENQGPILFNSQETKAVVEAYVNGKYVVSIYDVPGWNKLYTWELTKLTAAHCPDCIPMSYGWLGDGLRLFFNLDLGDEDSIDPSNHNVPGVYLISEDGTDLGSISPDIGHMKLGGYKPDFVGRFFLGQLADGSYLFQGYAAKEGHSPSEAEPFLVVDNLQSKPQKQFSLPPRTGSWAWALSGEYVAYIEERQLPTYQSERHLWVKNLQSGEEKELFVAPPPNPANSTALNITLTVLGWLRD